MTVREMCDYLGLKLTDIEKGRWGDAEKIMGLNNSQKKIGNLINPGYLTELETLDAGVAVSSGKVAFSVLTKDVLKGGEGVLKVKITDGQWATETDLEKIKRTENMFHEGTVRNPLYYVFQKNIYILPSNAAKLDVYFLRFPQDLLYAFTMAAHSADKTTKFIGATDEGLSADEAVETYVGAVIYCLGKESYHVVTAYDADGGAGGTPLFTVSPAAATDFGADTFYFCTHGFDQLNLTGLTCELNVALHELVVHFAEAELWGMKDGELDRQAAVLKGCYTELEALNAQYTVAPGVGSKNR